MKKKRLWGAFLAGLLALLGACASKATFNGISADKIQPTVVADQSFPAGLIGDTTVKFKPPFGTVDETLTLQEAAPVTTYLTQATRTPVQDAFKQGDDGASANETFPISSIGKLDMVVVVDDSASMASYQDLFQQGFQNLLSSVQNTDWQIVVTTSTASEPCLRTDSVSGQTVLTRAMYLADPTGTAQIFQRMATPGLSQNQDQGDERSLYGASRALDYTKQALDSYITEQGQSTQATCQAINWVRPGSSIAIFAVTDEDDCHASGEANFHHSSVNATVPVADTNYNALGGQPPDFNQTSQDGCSASEYNGTTLLTQLTSMGRTPGVDARFYAIYWRTGDAQSPAGGCGGPGGSRNSGSNEGWAYDNLITQTGGGANSFGDICDASFAPTLTAMSQDVSNIVARQVTLGFVPVTSSVVVTIDGSPYTDYSITGNVLKLNSVATTANTLVVTYLHDPTPIASSFKLSQVPATGTIAATVAGTAVDPTTLIYDPTSGELEFATQPADDADIVVTYRQDTPLPASLDLSALNIDGQPLAITIAGQPASGATYDPTTKQLAFATAPTDGSQIGVTYRVPNDKVTSYPAPALQAAALISMTVTDATTNDPITTTLDGSNIVFNADDVVDGRIVNLAYDYGDSKTVLTHTLANTPIAGSVQTTIDDGSPDCLNNITIVGTTVDFTCDASTIGEVAITYKFISQHYTTFTVDQPIPPGAFIMVYVDGQALTTSQWTESGQTFTVSDSLTTVNSTVRILASSQTVAN